MVWSLYSEWDRNFSIDMEILFEDSLDGDQVEFNVCERFMTCQKQIRISIVIDYDSHRWIPHLYEA